LARLEPLRTSTRVPKQSPPSALSTWTARRTLLTWLGGANRGGDSHAGTRCEQGNNGNGVRRKSRRPAQVGSERSQLGRDLVSGQEDLEGSAMQHRQRRHRR
jgi:hypothetical protein